MVGKKTVVKYLKQQDYVSCGPVAIINAMKWKGIRATRESHLKKIKKECRCDRYGTYPEDMAKVLKKYIPSAEHIYEPSIRLLDNILDLGLAAIIGYSYLRNDKVEEAHYVFCIGRTEKYYKLVNDVNLKTGDLLPKTISKKSKSNMFKMLSYKWDKYDEGSELWII